MSPYPTVPLQSPLGRGAGDHHSPVRTQHILHPSAHRGDQSTSTSSFQAPGAIYLPTKAGTPEDTETMQLIKEEAAP